MQKLGPWKRLVACLSKKLDNVATGWPPCRRMMAAVVVLVKLTLGQALTVVAPHAMETVVHQPPDRWLSNAQITYYQAMLLNSEQVQFGPTASLNPATLLPNMEPGAWVPHDCHQILAETHGTREDLTISLFQMLSRPGILTGAVFCKTVSGKQGRWWWRDRLLYWPAPCHQDLGTKSGTQSTYSSPTKGLRKKD